MRMKDGNYHVQYTFQDLGPNSTQMTYYEWVKEGTIEDPFTIETLNKLKQVIEN
jgi:hypothetical protein